MKSMLKMRSEKHSRCLIRYEKLNGCFIIQSKYILSFQNGDGFINRQELGYVMDNLGEKMEKEEIECLINEIDIDGE